MTGRAWLGPTSGWQCVCGALNLDTRDACGNCGRDRWSDADPPPDPGEDDGCDHACGDCGRGLPSYQRDGSLCDACERQLAEDEARRAIIDTEEP